MIIEHFQGDTFIAEGQLLNDLGTPVDLTAEGVTVRSEVRLDGFRPADAPVATLTSAIVTTDYTLTATDTTGWPTSMLVCNVRYVKDGKTFSTHEFKIKCMMSPTQ